MKVPKLIREPLLSAATRLGYGIYKLNHDGSLYGAVVPEASYSPWNKDRQFRQTYDVIRSCTLVDQYRCYELWTLVQSVEHCEGDLIEIGVWRGGTGALIAKRALMCGITETVYLCDTFSGVVKASEHDPIYVGGEHADASRQQVESLVTELGLQNVQILQGVFPEDTGPLLEQSRFRFCHIDVDVYQSAKDIVEWIWCRLAIGGVIVFDDYGNKSCAGITRCVDEQRDMKDRVTIHNLNGHAITIKTG
jgi:O-methyltransferase